MKRFILLVFAILLLTVSQVSAFTGSLSSGEQTSDAAIHSDVCWITAIHVITDGTNAAKVVIYDNTAASGKVISEASVAGTDNYGGRLWTFPIVCRNGIYVDVTGTGASYIVEYITQ